MQERKLIKVTHLEYADARGLDKTYCPSEVARTLFPDDWRTKMDVVRAVADDLVKKKKLVVLQKGKLKTNLPSELKGPIRLRKA